MDRFRHCIAAMLLTVPLWFAAGCKQGAGQRCQVQSDCEDGLFCVLPASGTAQAGGTCQAPGTLPSADMAVAMPDLAMPAPTDMPPVNSD